LDIAGIKYISFGGNKYWVMLLDDCTDFVWSIFVPTKSGMVKPVLQLLKELKATYGLKIKFIRCDNAGENKSLEEACIAHNMEIVVEYTPAGTPQRNGRVERKFTYLFGKTRSVLNAAGLEGDL